jgi:hypothetical protein
MAANLTLTALASLSGYGLVPLDLEVPELQFLISSDLCINWTIDTSSRVYNNPSLTLAKLERSIHSSGAQTKRSPFTYFPLNIFN